MTAEDTAGRLVCGKPQHPAPVGLRDIKASDITVNHWGELTCVAVVAAEAKLATVETINGEWDQPEWHDAPSGAVGVACLGHRTGIAFAVAASSGSWVRSDIGEPWSCLSPSPASRVVMASGQGWRVQIAGIAGHRIHFAEEATPGVWTGQAAEIR